MGFPHSDHKTTTLVAGLGMTGMVAPMVRRLPHRDFAPLTITRQARVALGDEIGEALGAAMVIVLIGERPGLSAADGIGAYLTLHPRLGRRDAERNCVSNIGPGGLPLDQAADLVASLTEAAFALGRPG